MVLFTRMMHRVGVESPEDYYDFLKFIAEEEDKVITTLNFSAFRCNQVLHHRQKKNNVSDEAKAKKELRKRNKELRTEIDHVLDDDEAGEDEEHK